jgi:hypothetical protein
LDLRSFHLASAPVFGHPSASVMMLLHQSKSASATRSTLPSPGMLEHYLPFGDPALFARSQGGASNTTNNFPGVTKQTSSTMKRLPGHTEYHLCHDHPKLL